MRCGWGALSTWGARIAEAPSPQPSPAGGRGSAGAGAQIAVKIATSHNPAAIRPGRHIYSPLTMLGLVICCGARFGLLEPGDKGNIFANGFRVFADGVRRTVPGGCGASRLINRTLVRALITSV